MNTFANCPPPEKTRTVEEEVKHLCELYDDFKNMLVKESILIALKSRIKSKISTEQKQYWTDVRNQIKNL